MSRITGMTPFYLQNLWRNVPASEIEQVTYFPKGTAGTDYGDGIIVTSARRHIMDTSVYRGPAIMQESKQMWGLWIATAATLFIPRPGDRIRDSNNVNYLIQFAHKRLEGWLYNCDCRTEMTAIASGA